MGNQADSTRAEDGVPHAKLEQGDHSSFKKGPKFSFGSKERGAPTHGLSDRKGARRPDPGAYNSNDLATSRMTSSPAFSASPRRQKLEPVTKTKEPGPGTFSVEECN